MEDPIYKAYEGREKFWIVYWIYGFFGAPLFTLLLTICLLIHPTIFMLIAYFWFLGAYMYWITVSGFRCRKNIENKKLVWGIIIGVEVALIIIAGVTGFSLSSVIIPMLGVS